MSQFSLKQLTDLLTSEELYLLTTWRTAPEVALVVNNTYTPIDRSYYRDCPTISVFFSAISKLAYLAVKDEENHIVFKPDDNEFVKLARNYFGFVWRPFDSKLILTEEKGFNYLVYAPRTGEIYLTHNDDSGKQLDINIVIPG